MNAELFTGLRCDRPNCEAAVRGVTDTPEQRRRLILRAEEDGWQCVHVDGKSMQFCAEHVVPELETKLRRLK